jgi:hypothetical protein
MRFSFHVMSKSYHDCCPVQLEARQSRRRLLTAGPMRCSQAFYRPRIRAGRYAGRVLLGDFTDSRVSPAPQVEVLLHVARPGRFRCPQPITPFGAQAEALGMPRQAGN